MNILKALAKSFLAAGIVILLIIFGIFWMTGLEIFHRMGIGSIYIILNVILFAFISEFIITLKGDLR